MSGHSKWSSIKHKKGAADAKRGKLFTKLARAITVAARDGGGDVDANPALALAVQKARDASMPKDNIQRAIDRGTGAGGDAQAIESVTYEGYGPGGAAIMAEALTDNRNRTGAEVRHAFERHGGSLGEPGSVAWQFENRGVILIDGERYTLEEAGVEVQSAEPSMEPKATVVVGESDAPALLRLMDALEEHDDVDSVQANFDVPEEILEKAAAAS